MGIRVLRSRIAWMVLSLALLTSLGLLAATPPNASAMGTAAALDGPILISPAQESRVTEGIPYRDTPVLAGKARVLLVHSLTVFPPDAALTSLAANYPGDIALLDRFNTSSTSGMTPTLSQLSSYDVVIVATDYFLTDGVLLGDRLADYIDMGGRVIVTMSSWIPGWSIGGRFASEGYFPFAVADTRNSGAFSLGSFDSGHPIMSGVTTLGAIFRSSPTTANGAYVVAKWNDDQPLAVVKGSVVGLNALPAVGYMSGDVGLLFHNAITYLVTPRIRVLVAAAHPTFPIKLINELVKDPLMGRVDYVDAGITIPALSQLATYDAVITYPDNPYDDEVPLGNHLADYVDIGGKVILSTFCWQDTSANLKGRIMTAGYSPLDATTHSDHNSVANLGAFDSESPIMLGVTAASTQYRDYTALASGATWVASWDDAENLVAYKGSVVAINGYLGEGGTSFTGDLALMARNAVKYLVLVRADFSVSSSSGSAPLTVAFTGTATGGQPPYTYLWQFGDGLSSTAQNPSHTFTTAGIFPIIFTSTDSAGHTGTLGFHVTVTPPLTLTAAAAPASGVAPLTVGFAASPSGGTPPYTYDWNYGDGSAHGTAQNPSHTYPAGGYVATLTVTDAASHTAVKTFPISSGPALAVTASATPTSGTAPLAVGFACLASGGTAPYAYAWAFGDGGTGTGTAPTHTYNTAGSYTATLTVTDSTSPARTATASVAITVTVLPPVVTSMKKGTPFKITVTGSNLQSGIQVFINGSATPWASVQYVSATQIKLTGGAALKAVVPKGVPAQFRFVNPDGGQVIFTWQY